MVIFNSYVKLPEGKYQWILLLNMSGYLWKYYEILQNAGILKDDRWRHVQISQGRYWHQYLVFGFYFLPKANCAKIAGNFVVEVQLIAKVC